MILSSVSLGQKGNFAGGSDGNHRQKLLFNLLNLARDYILQFKVQGKNKLF